VEGGRERREGEGEERGEGEEGKGEGREREGERERRGEEGEREERRVGWGGCNGAGCVRVWWVCGCVGVCGCEWGVMRWLFTLLP
jgi:hypothetical protein